jgi:hypothetical protein
MRGGSFNKASKTHGYSKKVGVQDGYRPMNRGRMKSSDSRVDRPDVAYSTGRGRVNPGNSTIKNAA